MRMNMFFRLLGILLFLTGLSSCAHSEAAARMEISGISFDDYSVSVVANENGAVKIVEEDAKRYIVGGSETKHVNIKVTNSAFNLGWREEVFLDERFDFLAGKKIILNLPQNQLSLKISDQKYQEFKLEKYGKKAFVLARLGKKDSKRFVRLLLFFKREDGWKASLYNVPYDDYELSFLKIEDQREKVILKKGVHVTEKNTSKLNENSIDVELK